MAATYTYLWPKQQLVECTTILCNSVAKHRLHRRSSTPASTSLPIKLRPLIHTYSVNNQRRTHRSKQKSSDKDTLKTTRRCAVPSLAKTVFALPYF